MINSVVKLLRVIEEEVDMEGKVEEKVAGHRYRPLVFLQQLVVHVVGPVVVVVLVVVVHVVAVDLQGVHMLVDLAEVVEEEVEVEGEGEDVEEGEAISWSTQKGSGSYRRVVRTK